MARKRTEAEVDQFLAGIEQEANRAAGLDLKTTNRAVDYAVVALMKQAKSLSEMDYDTRSVKTDCPECGHKVTLTVEGGDPQVISRSLSHTSKMLDDVTRLREFAQGKADSRPERAEEWLKLLSSEQFSTVMGWLEAAKR